MKTKTCRISEKVAGLISAERLRQARRGKRVSDRKALDILIENMEKTIAARPRKAP